MRAVSSHPASWIALALLLLLSFCLDFANVVQGGAIDLRNRVTGSRLLLNHIDPYFYKWEEPKPAAFCDPLNNPQVPVSKTTATPTLLALNIPLAILPYRLGQFLWLLLQWLLLLGTGWVWWRFLETVPRRFLLAAFVTGLTYTAAWRLHAERGQAYVVVLFLFAAWLGATVRGWPGHSFLTGMLGGVLVALRPPFLLLAPFLVVHRRGQLPGFMVGLFLAIALPTLWRGDCWVKYDAAMQMHSVLYRNSVDPAPGPERFPAVIEGMSTDLLANYVTIPYADFSVHALLRGFGLEPSPAWPLLAVAGAAFCGWLLWSRGQSMERLVLGLAVWLFLVDLCLPAYRDSYNDVLIVNIVALGLLGAKRVRAGGWICFLALPVGWAIYCIAPMHDWMIDLPSFLFVAGAVTFLLGSNWKLEGKSA